MKTTIISVIFLLLLVASTGKAQEQAQSKFEVYSVSFTAGWYQPSMDYWNDTYLPVMEVTDEFGGDITMGGEITFALPYNLRARGGISYWKQKVEGDAGSAISSLQIGFTTISNYFSLVISEQELANPRVIAWSVASFSVWHMPKSSALRMSRRASGA